MTTYSYALVENCLLRACNVQNARTATFRSRIKQLQRLSFPYGVKVGRGRRMEYSIEHILQLTFAFELLGIGIPGATAIHHVNTIWPQIQNTISTSLDSNRFAIIKHKHSDLSEPIDDITITLADEKSLGSNLSLWNIRNVTLILDLQGMVHKIDQIVNSIDR